MKQVPRQDLGQKHNPSHMPKPEVRDNLDSRKNKEDNYKDNNNKQGRKPNTKDKNEAGN
jgi:hypothetical protein